MIPAAKIIDPPWLKAAQTVAVIKALTADGATARFVGGCVRDALLERPVRDIDIATPDTPETVIGLLEHAGATAIPTGLSHGTVTAVMDGEHFEITTLRRDVKTDGRHAEVAFTGDWEADARRRDFTINALYCGPGGDIFDPTGGLGDIEAGRVRFIGDGDQRIIEDGLRILRFFRFHAWYGRGGLDAPGLAACARRAGDLANLSAERIAGELERLLSAPEPVAVLRVMADHGILPKVLPEASNFDGLDQLVKIETQSGRVDPWRRMIALCNPDELGARAIARRLKLSNKLSARLTNMARPALEIAAHDPHAEIYRHGLAKYIDRALLAWAANPTESGWPALIEQAESWPVPEFPASGQDVIALGIAESRAVGEVLLKAEVWWIEHGFPADRELVLARLTAFAEAATTP